MNSFIIAAAIVLAFVNAAGVFYFFKAIPQGSDIFTRESKVISSFIYGALNVGIVGLAIWLDYSNVALWYVGAYAVSTIFGWASIVWINKFTKAMSAS